MLRILILTKIFPNRKEPASAPFNRQQFAALAKLAKVDVLATIPWFPGVRWGAKWSAAARLREVPYHEQIDTLFVRHPRFAYIPKVGHAFGGPLYAASLLPTVLRYRDKVDIVLGSWAYPDGFAAVVLARALGVPAAVKLHGSDINVLSTKTLLRPWIRWTLAHADQVIAVSKPLAQAAIVLGAAKDHIHIVLNGVDRSLFSPADRNQARVALGEPLTGRWILYVGHLERSKGVVDLLSAFAILAPEHPTLKLVLVGDGSARTECEQRALGLGKQVLFAGAREHQEIPRWIAASDVLALPSWNEGTPNVVLEALASGRRVVASSVGGIPALIESKLQGELVPARDPAALAAALLRAASYSYDPHQVAASAVCGGWEESAKRLYEVLEGTVAAFSHRRGILT